MTDRFWMIRDMQSGQFYTCGNIVHLPGEAMPRIEVPLIATETYARMLAAHLGDAEVIAFPPEPEIIVPQYPLYSQRDPRWGKDLMNGSVEIEDFGCLITAVAIMLVHATGDDSINPGTLNAWLNAHNGYTFDNRFIWASIEDEWPVEFLTAWDYPYPKRADTTAINARIEDYQYALVKVDFNPATAKTDEHWVIVTNVNEDQTYQIIDPWYGQEFQMPPAYANNGWAPGDTIFRVAFYEKRE